MSRGYLVSRYISNPHLLEKFKYDLRIYVLVTSFDPLRIYMYKNGLARFATEKYSVSNKSCKKRYVHLTNYAVNKKAKKFVANVNPKVSIHNSLLNRMMALAANGV